MRVDLIKLIQDLLMPSLRKINIIEFIRVLLAQVPYAHNQFELFSYNAKYKANANASVISLEHHINREFDVKAKITELDGKPIDFLVTINGNVDEIRLRALIDSYKLYGKSYIFKLGEVKYIAQFINHQCENIIEAYRAEFIDHSCEEDNFVYLYYVVEPRENNGAANEKKWQIRVVASKPIRSDLAFWTETEFKYDKDGVLRYATTHTYMKAGQKEIVDDLPLYETELSFTGKQRLYNIEPSKDEYYKYVSKNN